MNNINIQYFGFHPSDYTVSYIDEWISEIHREAHPGSIVKSRVTRVGPVFKISVYVSTHTSSFFVESHGINMKAVCRHLVTMVRRKIEKTKVASKFDIHNFEAEFNKAKEEERYEEFR